MITWSKKALVGLDKIFSHVTKYFSEDKAVEVLERLKSRLTQELTTFPRSGKKISKKFKFIVIDGNKFYFEIIDSRLDHLHIEIVFVKPRGTK